MQVVRAEARDYFWPAQLGVAVPAGAEAAVHTVRAWLARHTAAVNKVIVKLDFRNAFNLVNRDAVLQEARLRFPALARWATWCYGEPSRLQYGPATLQSCMGVQQGDPLGPLLFAAAVHRLALDLKAGPLDLSMFYLDDGLLAGDIGPVANALHHIQQRATELGLHLNLQSLKSLLWELSRMAPFLAPCPQPFVLPPMAPAGWCATLNSWARLWAQMLSWMAIPAGELNQPQLCWMPWVRWRTLRWPCGC